MIEQSKLGHETSSTSQRMRERTRNTMDCEIGNFDRKTNICLIFCYIAKLDRSAIGDDE